MVDETPGRSGVWRSGQDDDAQLTSDRSAAKPTSMNSNRPSQTIPLIGRRPELEILEGEWRRVVDGRFKFILIHGPAGVGKSRLIDETVNGHRDTAVILSARSYRLGSTTSFGPWLEAIDRHILETGGSPEREHLEIVGDGEPHRQELLEEMTTILARLSTEKPVMLALDDIDLADDSSWEALRFMSRRLWNRRICILATARDGTASSRPLVGDVIHAMTDDGAVRMVNLRPLSTGEIAQLADVTLERQQGTKTPVLPETLVDWLMKRSLGHPLFALNLLEALIDQGADLATPELSSIPSSLRERIALELPGLEPDARAVLELLVVVGQRTDPSDLAEILSWSLTRVGTSLEQLCGSGLVREESIGPGFIYEIAHPLIQDIVYDLIGGARRMALHRFVARVLVAHGRLGSAAAHFARSTLSADEETLEALCLAITEAEGKGHYREALAILEGLPDLIERGSRDWLHVLNAITWQSDWVVDHLAEGRSEGVITAMRRIEEATTDHSDLVAQGTIRFHLASLLSIGAGRIDDAESACGEAIDLFQRAGETERALLARNEMVWISSCAGDLRRSDLLASEILADAYEASRPLVTTQAAGSRAYALSLMGRFDESQANFEIADQVSGENELTYRQIWGLSQDSLGLALAGKMQESLSSVEKAFDIDYTLACDALGLERLAHVCWFQGNLQETVRLIDESGARRTVRGSRRRAWGTAIAAIALAEMGRTVRAKRYLEQADQTYGAKNILDWNTWCDVAAGKLSLVKDDPKGALDHYRKAAKRHEEMGALALEGLVLLDVAETAHMVGEYETMSRSVQRLERIAETVGGRLIPALAKIVNVMQRGSHRQPRLGPTLAAIDWLGQEGYMMLAAVGAHRAGLAMLESDQSMGMGLLERGARIADGCGAVWRRDRALGVLEHFGTAGQRIVGSVLGPTALTPRERDVAELAARGHTAPEIAERLFIGTRTVETHLIHIYPKLGVSGKRELVTNAQTLGLLDDTQ